MSLSRNIRRLLRKKEKAAAKHKKAYLEQLEPRVLLSADLSYTMVGSVNDLTLELNQIDGTDTIQLINYDDSDLETRVVASRALSGTGTVEIFGSSEDDILRLDLDLSALGGAPTILFAGGDGNDTIFGPDAYTDWIINGPNSGVIAGHTTFEDVEQLFGGSGDDTFVFIDNWGSYTITSAGELDYDTLDFSFVTADLTFTFHDDGTVSVTDGTNTLGASGGIDNIIGGSGGNLFRFEDGGYLAGYIQGGTGTNILDYSAYSTAIFVDFSQMDVTTKRTVEGADQYPVLSGLATGLLGINGIQSVIGGSSAGDRLIGPQSDTTWTLSGMNSGTLAGQISVETASDLTYRALGVTFSGIETMVGQADFDDTFIVQSSGEVSGALIGNPYGRASGTDTLQITGSYSAVKMTATGEDSGRIARGSASAIYYAGIESVVDLTTAAEKTVANATGNTAVVYLSGDPATDQVWTITVDGDNYEHLVLEGEVLADVMAEWASGLRTAGYIAIVRDNSLAITKLTGGLEITASLPPSIGCQVDAPVTQNADIRLDRNVSGRLTVEDLGGAFNAFEMTTPTSSFVLKAGGGDDRITVGSFTPPASISIDGEAGDDSIFYEVQGGSEAQSVIFGTGAVTLNSVTIFTYSYVESPENLVIRGTEANDQMTLAAAGGGRYKISTNNTFKTITFDIPDGSVTVEGEAGQDKLTLDRGLTFGSLILGGTTETLSVGNTTTIGEFTFNVSPSVANEVHVYRPEAGKITIADGMRSVTISDPTISLKIDTGYNAPGTDEYIHVGQRPGDDAKAILAPLGNFNANLTLSGGSLNKNLDGQDSIIIWGDLMLSGHTLDITADTIVVKSGVTVSTSASGTAGAITLEGHHITLEEGAKLLAEGATAGDIMIMAVDNTSRWSPFLDIDISSVDFTMKRGAEICGGDVTILASADSRQVYDATNGSLPATVLDTIGSVIEGLATIEFTLAWVQSSATIDIEDGSAITAGNFTAWASSYADVKANPTLAFLFGGAAGVAVTDAVVTIAGDITTTGSAVIRSTTDHTMNVVADPSAIKGIAAAVSVAVIVSNSTAQVTDDSLLNIGGDLYVMADTIDRTRNMARSAAGKDGAVGIALAVTVEDGKTNAYLDGNATVIGDVVVSATMVQDLVPVSKLFVLPSTAIGTMAQAGVGSNSKGDVLDDFKSGLLSNISTFAAGVAGKVQGWVYDKLGWENNPSKEFPFDIAAAVAFVYDTNQATARIGDGNADGQYGSGMVDAAGSVGVISTVASCPYISSGASTKNNPDTASSPGGQSDSAVSGSAAISVGFFTNEANAFIGENAVVDADGTLLVQAAALNDYVWTWGKNLLDAFREKPTYTSEETELVNIEKGNIVEVAKNHTAGGDAGTWYEYIGENPIMYDVDLSTVDYSDEDLWESINPIWRKGMNFVTTLTTYLSGDFGISNWISNSWSQATAEGEKLALAGAVSYLEVDCNAEAAIKAGAQINQKEYDGTDQDVIVKALSSNEAIHLGGNISLPGVSLTTGKGIKEMKLEATWKPKDLVGSKAEKGSAVGATFLVFNYGNTTTAVIEDGVQLHADSLYVDAETEVKSIVIGASGGDADNFGLNGVVIANIVNNKTTAQIENGAVINVGSGSVFDPGNDPAKNGSVIVNASDSTWVIGIGGGVAVSESIGIGATVGLNIVNRVTEAVIGDLADDETSGPRGSFTVAGDVLVNAENKGFIGTFAVAGAVASAKSDSDSGGGGGDPGTGGTQGSDGSATSNEALATWQSKMGDVLKEAVDNKLLEGSIASASDSTSQTSQSKSGFGLSGSVAVNVIDDDARAYVLNAGAISLGSGNLTLNAANTTSVGSLAGAGALAKSSGDGSATGLAGGFGVNVLMGSTEAYIAGASSLSLNDLDIEATRSGWTVSLAAGLAGATGSEGVAGAGSVGVNVTLYNTEAGLRDMASQVRLNNVLLDASDDTNLIAIAGSGAFGGKTGVGIAIGFSWTENTTLAEISGLGDFRHAGTMDVLASGDGLIVAVTGSVGISTGSENGYAGAGTVSVNIVKNTIEANILNTTETAAGGSGTLLAEDKAFIFSFAGAFAGAKSFGLGAAIAVNSIANDVTAAVENSTLSTSGDFSGKAGEKGTIVSLAVGGAGSEKLAIAGAVGVNVFKNTIDAHISGNSDMTVSGDLSIEAEDTTKIIAVAGAVSFAVSTGQNAGNAGTLGASIAVNVISNTVQAAIQDSEVDAGSINVEASSDGLIWALAVAGSLSATTDPSGGIALSVDGSGTGNVVHNTTKALISGSTLTTRSGAVALSATDNMEIIANAGGLAVSIAKGQNGGTAAAVGVSVAINEIENETLAQISDSDITSAGAVSLEAESTSYIWALTIAGAVGGAGGQGGGIAITGAGSGSGNTVKNKTKALITDDSTVITENAGAVILSATDDTTIIANAGGVQVSVALGDTGSTAAGAGVSVAINDIQNETLAQIIDSAVTSAGAVSLMAESTSSIWALTIAAAVDVAVSGNGTGVSIAGAGSGSGNKVRNKTRASVTGGSRVTTANGGAVELSAKDETTIIANAGALGIAVASGTVSGGITVGVSITDNDIENTTQAVVYDSDIDSAGAVSLSADSTSKIHGLAAAGALSVAYGSDGAAVALSGAGAEANNKIGNTVEAVISDSDAVGSTPVTAGGDISLSAADSSTIKAYAVGGAVSVGVSGSTGAFSGTVGVARAINTIGNDVLAAIGAADVTAASGAVTLTAGSTADIDALAVAASVGFTFGSSASVTLTGAGAEAKNTISNTAKSLITGGSEVEALSRVSLGATDGSSIKADVVSATVSAGGSSSGGAGSLAVGVTLAKNTIENTTQAAIDGSTVNAGSVAVNATASDNAKPIDIVAGAWGTGVNALTPAGRTGQALDGSVVVDETEDSICFATEHSFTDGQLVTYTSDLILDNSGLISGMDYRVIVVDESTIKLKRRSNIDALGVAAAASITGSSGLALSGAGTGADVDNLVSNTVQAAILNGSNVTATEVSIAAGDESSISADVVAATASVGVGSSGTLSLAIAVSLADNRISNTTQALIEDSSVQAGGTLDITADSSAYINVVGVAAALSIAADSGSLALGASVTVAEVKNSVDGSIEAVIADADEADGQSVEAGGPITISATNANYIKAVSGSVAATVSATAGAVSIGAAAAAALAENEVGTDVTAGISNSTVSTTTGGVAIEALSDTTVDAVTFAASLGLSASSTVAGNFTGAGARATNSITGTTLATIEAGSDVDAPGDISLDASDTSTIKSDVVAASLSIAASSTAGLSIGISVSLAENTVSGSTIAQISGSDVDSFTGAVSMSATGENTIGATTVAAAVSISGSGTFSLSGAGSGASAKNRTTNTIESSIESGSHVDAAGSVTLSATDTSTIDAILVAGSVAVGGSGTATVNLSVAVAEAVNEFGTVTRAAIDGSDVISTGGGVSLEALSKGSLTAYGIGVGVSAGGSGVLAINGTVAGTLATTNTTNLTEAVIVGDSTAVARGGSVALTATDETAIDVDVLGIGVSAGGGQVSIGLAISFAVAETDVSGTVRTKIEGSFVEASGDVILTSLGGSEVDTDGKGIAISVSGALYFALAGAGTGADVSNTIGQTVEALILNCDAAESHSVTSGGKIQVKATDDLHVYADTLAVSASLSGGISSVSISVSAAMADNTMEGSTTARIGNSRVDANGGSVEVSATSSSILEATPDAVAAAASISIGFSGAGSGAEATNEMTRTITAAIDSGSDVTASASVLVEAHDDSDAIAKVWAVSATAGLVGISVGVGLATNTLDSTTTAYVSDSSVHAEGGSITINADATQDVEAKASIVSVTLAIGAAGAGGDASTTINSDVEAYARNATLTASGDLFIDADSDHTARAKTFGLGAALGVAVSVMYSEAYIGGATRAYVDGTTTIDVDSKAVITADSIAKALPDGDSISISLAGGAGAVIDADVDRTIEAYVGTRAGETPVAQTTVSLGTDDLFIKATSDYTAEASPFGLSFGLVASGAVTVSDADIKGRTLAYVGEKTTVTAGGLDIIADSTEKASANNHVIALSPGLSVGVADGTATVDSLVSAFIGAQAGSTPTEDFTTTVSVGGGSVAVVADSDMHALATTDGGGGSLLLQVTSFKPTALVSGTTSAYVRDGVSVVAGDLDVSAGKNDGSDRVKYKAEATSFVANVGLIGAVQVAGADATVDGVIEAYVGAPNGSETVRDMLLDIDGPVDVMARSDIDAVAITNGGGGSAGVTVSSFKPTADAGGVTRAYGSDGLKAKSETLNIGADGDAMSDARLTTVNVSGVVTVGVIQPIARATNVVEAYLGENRLTERNAEEDGKAVISVSDRSGNGGTVVVDAVGRSKANADASGFNFALGVTVSSITPKAELLGETCAYVGPATRLNAGNVNLSADDVSAQAIAKADGGSGSLLVNVSTLKPEAAASRLTEAFIGEQAEIDLGEFTLTVSADTTLSQPMAEAHVKGGSGAGIANVSTFKTIARVGLVDASDPASQASATRAFIGDNAVIVASNLTLDASSATEAKANISYFGFGGAVDVALGESEATAAHQTEAYVGDDVKLTLSGALDIDAFATAKATPVLDNTSVSLVVGVTNSQVKSIVDSDTGAWIGNGGEIEAQSVRLKAEATHTANASVNSGGFAGLVKIGQLTATAEDNGSVTVRIGPESGGTPDNPTKVTATGAAGIDVDAKLTTGVTASPNLKNFSLLASGGKTTKAIATNNATVTALIGEWADIEAKAGDVDMQTMLIGFAKAEAASTAGAGVAVSLSLADADFQPGVILSVAPHADVCASGTAGNVNLTALLNHNGTRFLTETDGKGAIGTANNTAGGLVAVSKSNVYADAAATLLVEVQADASLSAGNAVNVAGRNSNTALAALSGSGGGAVNVSTGNVKPTAKGSTTVSYFGDVGDGVSPGAKGFNLIAEGYTASNAGMSSAGGGAVTVDSGTAEALTVPQLTLNFGGGTTKMVVGGDINVIASQHSDADAKAKGASGGVVKVSNFTSKATVERVGYDPTTTTDDRATVQINVGAVDKVVAGGALNITAQHGAEPAPVSDGTFTSINGGDPSSGADTPGNTNYITFSVSPKLQDGAVITSQSDVGGLVSGRSYGVITRSNDTTIHLGESFTNVQVDTANDTIRFGFIDPTTFSFVPGTHNLQTGDYVYYFDNGLTPVGGLTSGERYKVFVVDGSTIKLQDPLVNKTVTVAADGSSDAVIDSTGHIIYASNSFADGDAVTYHAKTPRYFTSSLVDAAVSGTTVTPTDNNEIYLEGHGWSTGDEVVYRVSGGSPIVPLSDGTHYWVIKVDDNYIQLANSFYEAVGREAGAGPDVEWGTDDDITEIAVNPIDLDPDKITTGKLAVHSLRNVLEEALNGLTEGSVYFVSDRTDTSFKLKDASDSYVLFTDMGRLGGEHAFLVEGVDLTSAGGSGTHLLVLDLTTSATGGTFDGIGGAAGVSGAPSGDRQVTASTTGVGGGFVDVGSATATATVKVSTDIAIAGEAHLSANDIEIKTDSYISVYGVSDGKGGGFVAVGDAYATSNGFNTSTIKVGEDADLTASNGLKITSFTNSVVDSLARTGNGGFVGIADAVATSNLHYASQTIVDGDLTAGDTLVVESRSRAYGNAKAKTNTGGFVADGESTAHVNVGYVGDTRTEEKALTRTQIEDDADLLADKVIIRAVVENMRLNTDAETDTVAAGADCDAFARSRVASLTEARLLDGAEITGNESILVRSEYAKVDLDAKSDADLGGVGGDTDSHARTYIDTRAKVEGHWEAVLRTADLDVEAVQNNVTSDATALRDGAWFDGGSKVEDETRNARREIFWESHVIMMAEANPELEIDNGGVITKLTNIEFLGDNAGKKVGDTVVGGQVVLDDIVYDETEVTATFYANELYGGPLGEIWGNHALFEVQHTWDHVLITNCSDRNLITNLIDVSNLDITATIDVKVDNIYYHSSFNNDSYMSEDNPFLSPPPPSFVFPTFEFDLEDTFARTEVRIRNLQPGGIADSYVMLDGVIDNPIGVTQILNERGDILSDSDGDVELIRTNVLDLDATTGTIGLDADSNGGTRVPISVELVKFSDTRMTVWDMALTADAAKDVVLDITAHDRSQVEPVLQSFDVNIGKITAGDDVDLVVNDSKAGNDLADAQLGVLVNLFDPPSWPFTVFLNVNETLWPGPYYSQPHFAHFRPEVVPSWEINEILRAFGTDSTDIDSTYNFAEVRAGDDIEIGHITTTAEFGEPRSYGLTQITLADSDGDGVLEVSVVQKSAPNTTVHFIINTDVAWAGQPTPDDRTPQIFLTTNGDIEANEREVVLDEDGEVVAYNTVGDMLVGHIHSTAGNVTLTSRARILDADGQPTIDVTGGNIMMTAGTGGDAGGIGLTTDFLEINVDRNSEGGLLVAHDTAATTTEGIFLKELIGDMRIDTVHTRSDVSLVTGGGSLIDTREGGLGDDEPNVIGNTINLHANCGDIGDPSGGNDLEIDSQAYAAGTIGARADGSLLLTETAGSARVVLLQAKGTDDSVHEMPALRFTVRESGTAGEDLNLLSSGYVLFVEDAPETIGHGLIHAQQGSIVLRVGDNVTTDSNSRIVAAQNVDIYGDYGNADADGTTMNLYGWIGAGATIGSTSPEGSTPTADALYLTQIRGNTNNDTILFGKTSLEGAPGNIHLGSLTIVYGDTGNDTIDARAVSYGEEVVIYRGMIIFGGAGNDQIWGSQGDDLIFGDNGRVYFGTDLRDLDQVWSDPYSATSGVSSTTYSAPVVGPVVGGDDMIRGEGGSDTVIGGVGSDLIWGDNGDGDDGAGSNGDNDGNDVLIGDNARIIYAGDAYPEGTIGQFYTLGNTPIIGIRTTDKVPATETEPETFGTDTITGNAKVDVLIGGLGVDTIIGDGTDVIQNDNCYIIFVVGDGYMTADGQSPATAPTDLLSDADLGLMVVEAKVRWEKVLGNDSRANFLECVQVAIADLPGDILGVAIGDTILIDTNAAGYGWFIDPTPADDSEFADGLKPAGMDLLTVIMHEMGHVLGLADISEGNDIMSESLAEGVRFVPTAYSISGTVFSSGDDLTVAGLSGWAFGLNSQSMIFNNIMPVNPVVFAFTGDHILELLKVNEENSRHKLVSLTKDRSAGKTIRYAMEQSRSSWLVNFLVNGGEESLDPNKNITVII